jgi:hypothetical protein
MANGRRRRETLAIAVPVKNAHHIEKSARLCFMEKPKKSQKLKSRHSRA